MEYKDYYKTLGVDKNANPGDIKRAYRKLARKYHPDVSTETDAEDQFKNVGEAYEVLKNPEKRAAYDQLGNQWKQGEAFHPPPHWDTGFEFNKGHYSDTYSDFFTTLFGQSGPAGFHTHGQDHHAKIVITLEDAYHGHQCPLTLRRPEITNGNQIVMQEHTINVQTPRGVLAGQIIKLPGLSSNHATAEAADLYLEVHFLKHPLYTLDGRDIHMQLPVLPWEAALGETVIVPTLGGKVKLKIPAGSQGGDKLRLKGRGMPSKPPGNQYAQLKIVTPPANNEPMRSIYRQMRQASHFNPRSELGNKQ